MSTNFWVKKAAEIKETYCSWTELPAELEKIYGEKFSREQVRSAVREYWKKYGKKYDDGVEVKEGQEERTPLIQETDEGYLVTSGKRSAFITREKLAQLKEMYCGDTPLTMNQVCRKLDIPRRDFYLIKTAFQITHDDVPFLDEDLEERDLDDLVSETLEKRKEQYFIKLQQEEINQLKREVDSYRRRDYMADKLHGMMTEHMKEFAEYYQGPALPIRDTAQSSLMLEVPIVDLHLGRLAWKPETGENYDYKIADRRFMYVINDIAERVQGQRFEKIIFPIGNDFWNFDTIEGTTTAGTPQDNDLRWQKLYVKGAEMLIKAIDIFAAMGPVEVFHIPGNHDFMTSFYCIMYLSAWFRNNKNITVNTDPRVRKYIEFGLNLIGFSHWSAEKKRIFGNMQVEVSQAWGRTRFREWHTGHLHSEQVKEEHGVIVRRLSTVTGTDSWHYESGYIGATCKSQSFIWNKEKGLREILMTTVLN